MPNAATSPNLPPGIRLHRPPTSTPNVFQSRSSRRCARSHRSGGTPNPTTSGGVRRRRLLGRLQAQGRQGGVAAQRRLLEPGEDGPAPDTQTAPSARRSRPAGSSCSTWTRRITPTSARSCRGRSRRAPSSGCGGESWPSALATSREGVGGGSGDFVEQVSCELPLQAIAG